MHAFFPDWLGAKTLQTCLCAAWLFPYRWVCYKPNKLSPECHWLLWGIHGNLLQFVSALIWIWHSCGIQWLLGSKPWQHGCPGCGIDSYAQPSSCVCASCRRTMAHTCENQTLCVLYIWLVWEVTLLLPYSTGHTPKKTTSSSKTPTSTSSSDTPTGTSSSDTPTSTSSSKTPTGTICSRQEKFWNVISSWKPCWCTEMVHCKPFEYPPPCNGVFKNCVFRSAAQLESLKARCTQADNKKQGNQGLAPREAKCKAKEQMHKKTPAKQQWSPAKEKSKTNKAVASKPAPAPAPAAKVRPKRKTQGKKEVVIGSIVTGYKCKMCGKCFAEKFNLNKHSYFHKEKELSCLNCRYVTNSPYMLSFHIKKCVEGKVFPCGTCGVTFKHCMQVYRHCKKMHWAEQDFTLCESAFTPFVILKQSTEKDFTFLWKSVHAFCLFQNKVRSMPSHILLLLKKKQLFCFTSWNELLCFICFGDKFS